MVTEPDRMAVYEDARIIRAMIEHENNLQNYRVTWLMTIQGLLLAALGFSWGEGTRELVTIFCVLGLVVSLSSWSAMTLSTAAFKDLHDWWYENKPQDYKGPPVVGHKAAYQFLFWVLRPWRLLPWLFAVAWILILVHNWTRA